MQKLKQQIIIDLIGSPLVLISGTVGISSLFLSAIVGSEAALFGMICLLFSGAALLTNFIFNLGSISQRAIKRLHKEEKLKTNQELDSLKQKLTKTQGVEDEYALRNLRILHASFSEDLEAGSINQAPPELLTLVDEIFNACIGKLNKTFELYNIAKKLSGKPKEKILSTRTGLLAEVYNSIDKLADTIAEVRTLGLKTEDNQLLGLRNKLEIQLNIAKEIEEATLPYDMSRFKEYE